MSFQIKKTFSLSLALLAVAGILFSGCELDGKDEAGRAAKAAGAQTSVASGNALVGTWSLTDASGFTWYIHFGSDGGWKITNDQGGSERRVYGTYSTDGNSFSGDMTNPGVGNGRITGSFSDSFLSLDFVEYWHSPEKHVAYSGNKL